MCSLVQKPGGLSTSIGWPVFKKFENLSYYCYYVHIKLFILYYHKKEPGSFFQLQGIVFVSLISLFRSRIGNGIFYLMILSGFGLDDMTKLFAD